MKVNCKVCKTEFETKPARLKAGRGKYCSRVCFAVACKSRKGYWKGKKRLTPWMLGDRNHSWKGGFVSSHYSRKKGVGGKHNLEQWNLLKQKYNFMCLCCKQQEPFIKLTKDHVIPLSVWDVWEKENKPNYKGNDIENIQPLCFECNLRKMTKLSDYRLNGTTWLCLSVEEV